ncbi:hypothetical protein EV132_10875 [Rhizobium sullae]|uniref:Phage ABA sandwich domain-containing protein n=1 Tax=Rhizobium sullae TaxID=50338 RepID=A0A4R3Q2Z5_RHISU|nr:hypothetical protein EV132_10875 [Rhizobium sullae]
MTSVAMMDLIQALQVAKGPSRELDLGIAIAIGFTRTDADPRENESDTHQWISPTGEVVGKLPPYTKSLDHAYRLATSIAPSEDGGCGWEVGTASARLGRDPPSQAVTPAIALCIAALRRKLAIEDK